MSRLTRNLSVWYPTYRRIAVSQPAATRVVINGELVDLVELTQWRPRAQGGADA